MTRAEIRITEERIVNEMRRIALEAPSTATPDLDSNEIGLMAMPVLKMKVLRDNRWTR